MSELDLVVRNARAVTASDIISCDIGVREGRIVSIGEALLKAAREIDAAGRYVTPGGVDAHCHLDQPHAAPIRMADDFTTGSRSAACGGTTTIIPFAAQMKGQSLLEAVAEYHGKAEGKAHVDYAFHLIVTDPTDEVIGKELPTLIGDGYTSFKIYMTYDDLKIDDRQIIELLDVARRYSAMPMVHAENAECIEWLTKKLEAAGRTAPRWHAESRPMLAEREATHRIITYAELIDVPLLIVHVSGKDVVEQIRWARSRGLRILAETCPQYLFLTAADLGLDDSYEGARCVCSPPPRDKTSQKAIWDGLADGTFTVFSSDHAPYRFLGEDGKHPGGKEVAFRHIPNGIPGLETRMPLLWSEGVLKRRITPQKFVELTATNPAKTYGLFPKKGTIAVGADADLVVWEAKETTICNAMLHHAVDYTPYDGMSLQAWPAMTLLRGNVVWNGKEFAGDLAGRFLPCGRPSLYPDV
ncbi:MAG: dihydropyrimidinase [Rhizobiales bacterium]|nr:dihydropyrimidinase [Hyphomicrobiales bacterium]